MIAVAFSLAPRVDVDKMVEPKLGNLKDAAKIAEKTKDHRDSLPARARESAWLGEPDAIWLCADANIVRKCTPAEFLEGLHQPDTEFVGFDLRRLVRSCVMHAIRAGREPGVKALEPRNIHDLSEILVYGDMANIDDRAKFKSDVLLLPWPFTLEQEVQAVHRIFC